MFFFRSSSTATPSAAELPASPIGKLSPTSFFYSERTLSDLPVAGDATHVEEPSQRSSVRVVAAEVRSKSVAEVAPESQALVVANEAETVKEATLPPVDIGKSVVPPDVDVAGTSSLVDSSPPLLEEAAFNLRMECDLDPAYRVSKLSSSWDSLSLNFGSLLRVSVLSLAEFYLIIYLLGLIFSFPSW